MRSRGQHKGERERTCRLRSGGNPFDREGDIVKGTILVAGRIVDRAPNPRACSNPLVGVGHAGETHPLAVYVRVGLCDINAASRRIAAMPAIGPSASAGNAQCQPKIRSINGMPWIVTLVNRNPIDV